MSKDKVVPVEPTEEMIQAWHDRFIEGGDYIDRNSIEFALYAECYKAMLAAAPSRPALDWISVEDGLPEDGKTVLVRGSSYDASYQDGYVLARYYSYWESAKWVIGKQEGECYGVTHWQSLPPPPLSEARENAK